MRDYNDKGCMSTCHLLNSIKTIVFMKLQCREEYKTI